MKVSFHINIIIYLYKNIYDNLFFNIMLKGNDHFKKLRDILSDDFLNN